MTQYLRLLVIAALGAALASCGIRHIDAPALTPEDRWIKSGQAKNDIWRALRACGYDGATRDNDQRVAVDRCMLEAGFVFIDSPRGQYGAICGFPQYQHLPSCQSLKKSERAKGGE